MEERQVLLKAHFALLPCELKIVKYGSKIITVPVHQNPTF